MRFGEPIRELGHESGLTQQELASRLGVSVVYISKVEYKKLYSGHHPSEEFIHKLADAVQADRNKRLVLTERVPDAIRN